MRPATYSVEVSATPSALSAPPLRGTPLRFRIILLAGVVLVAVGYVMLLRRSSGPTPGELIGETGFLLLAALMLLADLYPLVPSMRDVRANVTFAWSAALSLAAVLAYGPTASLLFLASGLTAALSRRTERWWQVLVNMVIFGIIGLAVAALSGSAGVVDPLVPPGAWRLASWGLLLAVVVVVLYAVLSGVAVTQRGVSTWREQRSRFVKSVRIWGVSLITAPLLAALALEGPWALPCMAVVIISLNHLSSTMFRSTAASRTDGLTGLANRLSLTRRLSARIADLRPGQGVTLLLIDLNRFKNVNDTHGHLVGDQVLVAVGHRLRAATVPADLVARYGGDEFAVVLAPGSGAQQAAAAAETIRLALAKPVSVSDIEVVVGGSIGIAEATDPAMDVLGLVERADRDMYRAKRRQGGGRAPSVIQPQTGTQTAGARGLPTWSITMQGAWALPAAGWAGVQLSSSPSVQGPRGPAVWGTDPIEGGVR